MRQPTVLAMLVLGLGAPAWAQAVAPEPQEVDQKAAEQYNRFRDQIDRRVERVVREIARRYDLRDDQKEAVSRLVAESAKSFLEEHGRETFELFQRMRALREFMREQRLGWNEVPQDIKQELAERALPMIDAVGKRMTRFSEALGESLDPQQREKLQEDRQRMETGLKLARTQARLMSGRGVVGPPPADAAGGAGPAAVRPTAERRDPAQALRARQMDRWESYVRSFIERYRLDEVQKLQAMELLSQYRAKAEAAVQEPAAAAATQPTSRPATAEDFRQRLARLGQQQRPLQELFEQLKAELEQIPTPVQRKLAEENRATPGAGGEPPRQGAGRPEEDHP